MGCPRLKDLPPPPPGKTGWPWDEESPHLPGAFDESPLPRITIITTSYNRAEFLEECIRSVLLQGYPDLEYILIDGESTDRTMELIRKYDSWITYWKSEPDTGPTQAVNKALKLATGRLWGLANSDDKLLKGALSSIAVAHVLHPHAILAGDVMKFFQDSGQEELFSQKGLNLYNHATFWKGQTRVMVTGLFFPTSLLAKVGILDETLRHADDHEFLYRVLESAEVHYLGVPVTCFRVHSGSKGRNMSEFYWLEVFQICKRYWHLVPTEDRAAYKRFASKTLFYIGLHRCLYRSPKALLFLKEGLRMHPVWPLYSATKALPAWLNRKWKAAKN